MAAQFVDEDEMDGDEEGEGDRDKDDESVADDVDESYDDFYDDGGGQNPDPQPVEQDDKSKW